MHLELLENEPRAIYYAYVAGGEVMEKGHPGTVNEGDTRKIQGKAPTFGESPITTRIDFIDRLANDLTLYQQRHGVTSRLCNRYPYHQLHTLGTPFRMQVKSQFVSWLSRVSQGAENIKDIGLFVNR